MITYTTGFRYPVNDWKGKEVEEDTNGSGKKPGVTKVKTFVSQQESPRKKKEK